MRAFPLPRRHCRMSFVKTQTRLQALSLLSAYNTLDSAHISSDYAKKLISKLSFLEYYEHQNAGFIQL